LSPLKNQVGSAMVWSVVARGGRFALGILSSVIVVRSLGAHDYGVLSVVRNILMFTVILAGAGLGQACLKFLPALRVVRDGAGAARLVRTALIVSLLVWAALVVAAYSGRHTIESIFPYQGLGVILALAVALSLFEVFFSLIARILEANYDTRRLSLMSLASHGVFICALLVVLPRGWGVAGVIASAAAGHAVASIALFAKVKATVSRYGEPGEVGEAGAGISFKRVARYSLPLVLVGVLVQVVWRQSETLLLAHFRTAEETGFFDLAYRMPQTMLEFVPTAVWPLVMAGFSEVYARDPSRLRIAIDRYYRMLFLLCTPICVTGIVLGGRMVTVLYTDSWMPAAIPTQLFFAIFTLSFFGTPLSMTLYVLEKTHVILIVYVCLAALNVGLDLVLIPRYGVTGAIVPVALVTAMSPFIYRVLVRRYVDGVRIPLVFIGKTFLASGFVVILVPFTRFITGWFELAAAFVAAAVLVVLGYKLIRVVGRKEMDMLGAVPVPLANRLLKFIAASQ
jgi:O-antigen/teichoic acid export membrane protein